MDDHDGVTGRSAPGRVTFVGHDASRTGAPMLLLALVEWMPAEARSNCDLVFVRGGQLVDAAAAVVDTRVLGPAERAAATLRSRLRRPASPATNRSDRLIVAGSLAALTVASGVSRGARLVCHVHELDGVAARVLPGGARRDRAVARVDHFVAAGDAVGAMLTERWGIDRERVTVVDEFVGDRSIDAAAASAGAARLRSLLGIDAERPIVLAVGALGPRKGADHFVELMGSLRAHPSRPVGVWVGGDPGDAAWAQFAFDVAAAGSGGDVLAVPTVPDTGPYYDAATVVVSTAREDPFPLNVLEAGRDGVPVVAFASGGAGAALTEAGRSDLVVAVGDVLAMGDRVGRLLDDPVAAAGAGAALRSWVRSTHLTEHLAPRLWDALTRRDAR